MVSVKLQDTDFNFHIDHVGDSPSERAVTWVRNLKAREGSGRFNVTYEKLTGKIQGKTWDEVYVDELVQS